MKIMVYIRIVAIVQLTDKRHTKITDRVAIFREQLTCIVGNIETGTMPDSH